MDIYSEWREIKIYAMRLKEEFPTAQWVNIDELEYRGYDPTLCELALEYLYKKGYLAARIRSEMKNHPDISVRWNTVAFFNFYRKQQRRRTGGGKKQRALHVADDRQFTVHV